MTDDEHGLVVEFVVDAVVEQPAGTLPDHREGSQTRRGEVFLDLLEGVVPVRLPERAALPKLAGLAFENVDRHLTYFDDAERAALALAEAVTRLADHADPVPDATWDEAARHYDDQQLGTLVLTIATVNLWNRLNVTTRQVAGQEW